MGPTIQLALSKPASAIRRKHKSGTELVANQPVHEDMFEEAHKMGAGSAEGRTRSRVRFERLVNPRSHEFDQLVRIYREAIPASERKSPQNLAAMTKEANYRLFLAKVGARVVGFSIVFIPKSRAFALLEYMAIHEDERGKGLGTAVFGETVRAVHDELGPAPMLLEVDSDREDAKDHAKRVRRLTFYRRNGCRRLAGLHYILPLKAKTPPPAMDMLIYDRRDAVVVAKTDVSAWLQSIYTEVYRQPPDDPRMEAMLRPLPDQIEAC